MVKFETTKYRKIIKELVNSSFPVLKNKKINVKRVFFPQFCRFNAYATIEILFNKKSFIHVNPKYMNKFDNFELKGVFAHELCHIEDFLTNNRWRYFVKGLKYNFSKSYRERYEKEIDKKAIRKGYRKELKAFREKRWNIKDKNLKRIKRFYLSPREIDDVVC